MLLVLSALAFAAFGDDPSPSEEPSYTMTPDPTSRSGIPKIWVVVVSCVGALAIVFVCVVILCIKKPPEDRINTEALLMSRPGEY